MGRDGEAATESLRLERLNRRLHALSRAAVRVQEAVTPDQVLAEVGAQLTALGLEWHFALLSDDGDEVIVHRVSLTPKVQAAVEKLLGIRLPGFRVPVDRMAVLRGAVRGRRAGFAFGEEAVHEIFPQAPLPLIRQVVKLVGAQRMIVAPLLAREQVLGVISVWAPDLRVEDLDAIVVFAQQAAIALSRARLEADLRQALDRTQAHLRQAETLQRLSTLVATTLDFPVILERVADAFQEAFGADRTLIFLCDPESGSFTPALVRGLSDRYVEAVTRHYRQTVGGQVIRSLQPMAIEDVSTHPGMAALREEALKEGFRSLLALPLAPGGEAIGAVAIYHDQPRRYDEHELSLARVFSDQVAVAVRDAELYQRVQAERRQLETIIDQMAEGVAVLDGKENVVLINRAGLEILGLPHPLSLSVRGEESFPVRARRGTGGEVVVGPFRLVRRGRDGLDPYLYEETPLFRALARGEVVSGELVTIVRRGPGPDPGPSQDAPRASIPAPVPQYRDLVISVAPIRDERGGGPWSPGGQAGQGTPLVVTVFRDVTAEQALERAKEEFLAVAAHELRSPLSVLKGYADLLCRVLDRSDRPLDRVQVRDQIGRMGQQIARLTSLAEALLDVSRIEVGRLAVDVRPVEVVALVESSLRRLRETYPTRTITLQVVEPTIIAQADPNRLDQVLRNLVENALKHSTHEQPVEVTIASTGTMVEVRVRDRGPGIAAEHLRRIFERFYQAEMGTTRRTSGLGLGLYVTKGLVEAQGGTIDVESEPGIGTTFRFTLPMA